MTLAERIERTSTITSKGQVTLPIEIRRVLGVGPSDRVSFVVDGDQVRVQPARDVVSRTAGALRAFFPGQPLSAEDERRLFEEAVAEEAAESPT